MRDKNGCCDHSWIFTPTAKYKYVCKKCGAQ